MPHYIISFKYLASNKNEDSVILGFIHTPLHSTSAVILGMALGEEILYPKIHDLESNQSQVCRLQSSKDLTSNFCMPTL